MITRHPLVNETYTDCAKARSLHGGSGTDLAHDHHVASRVGWVLHMQSQTWIVMSTWVDLDAPATYCVSKVPLPDWDQVENLQKTIYRYRSADPSDLFPSLSRFPPNLGWPKTSAARARAFALLGGGTTPAWQEAVGLGHLKSGKSMGGLMKLMGR